MELYDIPIRLALAIAIGYVVGLERETHHIPAGIKTHVMVCMGATVVSMIQIHMIQDATSIIGMNPDMADAIKTDVGRMGAAVISGIGFLGAGTILQKKDAIKGLTTAATLWFIGCVGLAVGMGYYAISIFSFIGALLTLVVLRMIKKRVAKRNTVILEITFCDKKKGMDHVDGVFGKHEISIHNIEFVEDLEGTVVTNGNDYSILYTVSIPQKVEQAIVLREIACEDAVAKISNVTE